MLFLVYVNNCIIFESIGYLVYEFQFGRKLILLINVIFGLDNSDENKNFKE